MPWDRVVETSPRADGSAYAVLVAEWASSSQDEGFQKTQTVFPYNT